MTTMLSYHNDSKVKAKYVRRFAAHRKADEVIQGLGFENGRGCFVGCTLNNYDHSQFPIELGWPEWLARLADTIFEGLPKKDAPQFGTDLLKAVPVGVNLEPIRHMLAVRRLSRLIVQQQALSQKHPELSAVFAQTIASITTILRLHDAELCGNVCALTDWSAARSAARSARSAAESAWSAAESAESAAESAWSAAWSARSAAWSAARSARSAAESARSAAESAWSAAESAWSAAESAWSAAWSARSAAWSAAWSAAESAESAAYKQERDDLLEILRGLK